MNTFVNILTIYCFYGKYISMNKLFDISDFVSIATEQSVVSSLVERYKKRLKELKMTRKDMAEKSGVSYGSLRRFEASGEISLSSLLKVCRVMGCIEDFDNIFKNKIIKNLKDY